ncbi:MAG: type II toxin-antitoxin system HicA family toxin [Acidobacteriaceae bacterium]
MGQVGSHLVKSKPGERANLSIPQHKELFVGTLRALIRDSRDRCRRISGYSLILRCTSIL